MKIYSPEKILVILSIPLILLTCNTFADENTIEELHKESAILVSQEQYEQALGVLDQILEIDSDNVNSATENVTPDKQLSKPNDNLTLSLVVPELVEFLNLEFLSDNVTDNLSTSDNLSFSFLRQMYDNDTSKSFYIADCALPFDTQTGCMIRFDIEAIDFAGNFSTHDDNNTTDNQSKISPRTSNSPRTSHDCGSFVWRK